MHGLMAFAANWRKIANKLAPQYQCLIYDQRGHGSSLKTAANADSGYSLEVLAEDLDKITTELGWNRFHLVGHSMGASVAMVFAHKYPEKVKTLSLEDMGASVAPDSSANKHFENMLNSVPTPFNSKAAVKYFFDHEFLQRFTPSENTKGENPKVLVSFLQANIKEKAAGVFDWRFSKQAIIEIAKASRKNDRWLELSSFKMPVLLLRGENSTTLSAAEFEKMQQINPQISGVEIKGAAHWLHYEKHQEFTQVLSEFIQTHSSSRS